MSPFPLPHAEHRADGQFFYGVDWTSIRDIDAPFVPHLKSITDTSYFPTDEIDQTNDLPVGAESGDDAKKDLAFLGYTYVSLFSSSSFSPFCSFILACQFFYGENKGLSADDPGSVVTKCSETLCFPIHTLHATTLFYDYACICLSQAYPRRIRFCLYIPIRHIRATTDTGPVLSLITGCGDSPLERT
jgi:hypothetical protein